MTDITKLFGQRDPAPAPRASGGLAGLIGMIAGEPARPMMVRNTKARPMTVTSVEDLVACGMITPGLAGQIAPKVPE